MHPQQHRAWAGSAPPDFAALLRSHRLATGYTQEALAHAADVGVRTLRDLEAGTSAGPQPRTAQRLAMALRLGQADRDTLIATARSARIICRAGQGTGVARLPAVCSLPRGLPDFVGRAAELRRLRNRRPGDTLVVSGPPGVGKTTLVVHAARLIAGRHGSVLYADLAGTTGSPLPLADALDHLLLSFGVTAGRPPATDADRLGRLRRLSAGSHGVLVLDDATDPEQVELLRPPGSRWLVLVTARGPLTRLSDADRIELDPLPPPDAVALLSAVAGADRVARERAIAVELAELCGHLPLALRIVGNRLASRPTWTLQSMAERLRDGGRRLDALRSGDLAVRESIAASFRRLAPPVQDALRRLSCLEAVEADHGATDHRATDHIRADHIGAAYDSGLLQPTGVPGRFRLHPLVALYCAEQPAAASDGWPTRSPASSATAGGSGRSVGRARDPGLRGRDVLAVGVAPTVGQMQRDTAAVHRDRPDADPPSS